MEYAFRKALLVLTIVALVAVPVLAQRFDGGLRGTVTDQTGAVVAGAKVTVTNEGTGVKQTTETTSAGVYNFPNLLVGTYTLRVDAKGFSPFSNKGVAVSSNQVVEANAKMSVGGETTTVEVAAGAEAVETTTSQVSNNFGAAQIVDLPSASSNLLNLAVLAPGTTSQGGGVLGSGGSVGGARPRMNNFSVDGVDDNDQSVTGPLSTVVNDAVAEFSLITNQFSAEYGHSGAGQFNIITKSGTNNWHGSLAEETRNRNLNALDNLQKESYDPAVGKDRYDFNRLSGTIGGPIVKNKFFIFGAFQYHTRGLGASGAGATTPTAEGLSVLNGAAADQQVKDILAQFPVAKANDACDPSLPSTSTSPDKCPYVNGVAVPIGNVNFKSPDFYNEYDWHVNGDYNFTKHRLSARYLYNRYRAPNMPAPALPQFGGSIFFDVKKGTISDAWTINDHVINDFRFNFTHMAQGYSVPAEFADFPNVTLVHDLSNFVIGPESNSPQSGGQNLYQLVDQMSYSFGKHTFKFGGEVRRYISPSNFLPRSRGDWYYGSLQNLVDDTVPSDPQSKRGAGDGSFPGNSWGSYGFLQDDIKVNNKLTLNLGMRYEWNGIPFGSNFQLLNSISNLPGVYDFRIPKSDQNNWAPRFGFAYDPTGAGKWSIRGGFGISYDVNFTNLALLQLPPQLQSEQDPDITCLNPAARSWCADYLAGNGGHGFLAGGGLISANVPPTTQADARGNTGGIIVDNVAPKIMTWSLGVQRELFGNSTLEVRYLGTRAVELPVQIQTNARSAFDNGALPLTTWFSEADIPASLPLTAPTLAQFNAKKIRPYAADGFAGSVTAFPSIGNSKYNSVAADFTHRFTHGLYFRANYTFAKGYDNATNELFSSLVNPRRPEDGNHLANDWGRSTLDIRNKVAISWTYDIPKLKVENAFAKAVFHGWQINGAYILQSGQPLTVQSGYDANGNKDGAGDRAILNPNGIGNTSTEVNDVFMNPTTGATCLDGQVGCDVDNFPVVGYVAIDPKAKYVSAHPGALTNIARNTLPSPGLNNWDMSFFKNNKLGEKKNLQFRVELFNAFNHRQFSFANQGVFGTSDSATTSWGYALVGDSQFMNPKQLSGGSRQIQLGLKFTF